MSDTLVIRIHPRDDVVIARQQLVGGTRLPSEGITVSGLIPPGHKVATRPIAAGAPVRRYDQIIGSAKQAIAAGQHVHSHNLEFSSFARDYDAASGARATEYSAEPATFDGMVRADESGEVAFERLHLGTLCHPARQNYASNRLDLPVVEEPLHRVALGGCVRRGPFVPVGEVELGPVRHVQ